VVAGFRRLAAVRLLARERVLARLHGTLSDEDAWAVALSDALLREPLSADELASLRARLAAISLAPWADELVDEALVRAPVPAELRERFFEFLGAASSPSPSPSTSTTSIAPAPPEPSQSRDLSSTAPASSEPSQSRAPSSTALAPSEPSQSRAPTPGRDETRPGVRRDEPGQASTSVLTSTAPAPPEPSQSRAAAPGQGEPGQAFAEGEPAPGGVELVEVTADELVHDLVARLSQLNQDLAVAFEAWEDLPPEGRRAIVEQARYIAQLMPFMERE